VLKFRNLVFAVQGPAMALRNDVQSGAMNLKEKLSIELASDARRGKVTYGGHIFSAKVCTVPVNHISALWNSAYLYCELMPNTFIQVLGEIFCHSMPSDSIDDSSVVCVCVVCCYLMYIGCVYCGLNSWLIFPALLKV